MALQQPLLPTIRDYFKVKSYTGASAVPMAFALASATGQLPAGWMADRFGPTALIMIGTLGVAVAGVLVGISTTYVMLIVFLILMGLLSGGYHPAATPLISASVDPLQQVAASDLHRQVRHALESLPPQQRAAMTLLALEEMDLSDVADAMGCAAPTARVHVHRARRRLRELLAEHFHEGSERREL